MYATAPEIWIEGLIDLEKGFHCRIRYTLRRKRVHRIVVVLSSSRIVYDNDAIPVRRPLIAYQLVVVPRRPLEQIPECLVRREYVGTIGRRLADGVEIVFPKHLDWLCGWFLWIKRKKGIGFSCNSRITFRRRVRAGSAVVEREPLGRDGCTIRVAARFLSSRARHVVNLFKRGPHPRCKRTCLLSDMEAHKPHRYRSAGALARYRINKHSTHYVVATGYCGIAHLSGRHHTPRSLDLQRTVNRLWSAVADGEVDCRFGILRQRTPEIPLRAADCIILDLIDPNLFAQERNGSVYELLGHQRPGHRLVYTARQGGLSFGDQSQELDFCLCATLTARRVRCLVTSPVRGWHPVGLE